MIVLLGSILWHFYSYFAIFSVIMIMAIMEFYRVLRKKEINVNLVYGSLVAMFVYTAGFLHARQLVKGEIFLVLIVLFAGVFFLELVKKTNRSFIHVVYTIFGIVYISIPFTLLHYIVFETPGNYQYQTLLGLLFIIWTYDVFAYLSGKLLGKHKIKSVISPNKTWEGLIGGALITVAISYPVFLVVGVYTWYHWLIASVLVVSAATLGDFSESLFKRNLDLKDTGGVLPGHGGMLDRFDSLLMSAPVFFVYWKFFLI